MINNQTLEWLNQGDPSIVYKTAKYLQLFSADKLQKLQQDMLINGWVKRLREYRDKNGLWGNGFYSPKYISTTYTLLLLKWLEAPAIPEFTISSEILLKKGFWKDGGINYWESRKQSETCVTAITLGILSYFQSKKQELFAMADFLLREQMPDGGWNCLAYRGDKHSSFHTTTLTLEAFYMYTLYVKQEDRIRQAINRGLEFLLAHQLCCSHRTGMVVDYKMTRFSFPLNWRHDLFRGLEIMSDLAVEKDNRLSFAMEKLWHKKNQDNTWNLEFKQAGKYHFNFETVGKPSRVNTFRALKILSWWNGSTNN